MHEVLCLPRGWTSVPYILQHKTSFWPCKGDESPAPATNNSRTQKTDTARSNAPSQGTSPATPFAKLARRMREPAINTAFTIALEQLWTHCLRNNRPHRSGEFLDFVSLTRLPSGFPQSSPWIRPFLWQLRGTIFQDNGFLTRTPSFESANKKPVKTGDQPEKYPYRSALFIALFRITFRFAQWSCLIQCAKAIVWHFSSCNLQARPPGWAVNWFDCCPRLVSILSLIPVNHWWIQNKWPIIWKTEPFLCRCHCTLKAPSSMSAVWSWSKKWHRTKVEVRVKYHLKSIKKARAWSLHSSWKRRFLDIPQWFQHDCKAGWSGCSSNLRGEGKQGLVWGWTGVNKVATRDLPSHYDLTLSPMRCLVCPIFNRVTGELDRNKCWKFREPRGGRPNGFTGSI